MNWKQLLYLTAGLAVLELTIAVGGMLYVLTDLGDLPGGMNESVAFGVNSYGQVAGSSAAATGNRAFLWTPNARNGTTGSMLNLGDLPGGDDASAAGDINSYGQVVGTSISSTPAAGDRAQIAFLWTPTAPNNTSGSMTALTELPGGDVYSYGSGINALGQIAGASADGALSSSHASLWTPAVPNGTSGSMDHLGDLPNGTDNTFGNDINSLGQVVGSAGIMGGTHSFLWNPSTPNHANGSMINLGDLPGGRIEGVARGINNYGQVVGHSDSATGSHAFLWVPNSINGPTGAMVDLGSLAVAPGESDAWDIDSHGRVVGSSGSPSAVQRAFIWIPTTPNGSTGRMLDLNALVVPPSGIEWSLQTATGINDFGQIVGYGVVAGATRAFLLTPVPEPSNISLIGFAAILLTGIMRSQRANGRW